MSKDINADLIVNLPTKVAPSPLVIRRLNKVSVEHGFNRALTDDFIKRLDPNGVSLIKPILRHYHKHGQPTEDLHYRCLVFAKVKKQDEPVQVQLDLTPEDFDKLLSAEEYQAIIKQNEERKKERALDQLHRWERDGIVKR